MGLFQSRTSAALTTPFDLQKGSSTPTSLALAREVVELEQLVAREPRSAKHALVLGLVLDKLERGELPHKSGSWPFSPLASRPRRWRSRYKRGKGTVELRKQSCVVRKHRPLPGASWPMTGTELAATAFEKSQSVWAGPTPASAPGVMRHPVIVGWKMAAGRAAAVEPARVGAADLLNHLVNAVPIGVLHSELVADREHDERWVITIRRTGSLQFGPQERHDVRVAADPLGPRHRQDAPVIDPRGSFGLKVQAQPVGRLEARRAGTRCETGRG